MDMVTHICHPSCKGGIKEGGSQSWLAKLRKAKTYLKKITTVKSRGWGELGEVTQVTEYLPTKPETLNSNPCTDEKKQKADMEDSYTWFHQM
jgi:hypothetical protein